MISMIASCLAASLGYISRVHVFPLKAASFQGSGSTAGFRRAEVRMGKGREQRLSVQVLPLLLRVMGLVPPIELVDRPLKGSGIRVAEVTRPDPPGGDCGDTSSLSS